LTKTICGFPPRLFFYVATTIGVAAPLVVLALAHVAVAPPSLSVGMQVALFLGLALISDLRPVPLDERGNEVSLAFVFIVAARLLFGWQYAVPLAALSVLVSELSRRTPALRALFNSAAYALAAALTQVPSLLFGPIHGADVTRLTGYAFAGGGLFVLLNVLVVAGAASIAQGVPYRSVLAPTVRQGGGAFAIMAFFAALAANLWVLQPFLLVLLAGPLFTLTLYQRSSLHSKIATRDANTDNLTGLGNHRAYQAALREMIARAEEAGRPFSLCLVDVDDFKSVNDAYGHPAGDEALVFIAELIGRLDNAEAFRFGGDEFAVLIEADDAAAYKALDAIQQRLTTLEVGPAGQVTISAGIASYPVHATDLDELQRAADGALYWSKRHGKNQSCLYSPSVVRIYSRAQLERETERQARLRAAKNLVRFVDAKDSSTANHSQIVSTLAAEIGAELGLDDEVVEQLRLAGLLHDLGKIGLPDAILHAPRRLTDEEFAVVKRHPEFGFSLLEGMALEPIDQWVAHHHEHWDGSGYPDGLAGEEIPIGSRIILVADAFEAMTADRPYRAAQTEVAALEELRSRSGQQFDPRVVEALERFLLVRHVPELRATA
jgi:diguanylate cyclase (GGDEF)-like protein